MEAACPQFLHSCTVEWRIFTSVSKDAGPSVDIWDLCSISHTKRDKHTLYVANTTYEMNGARHWCRPSYKVDGDGTSRYMATGYSSRQAWHRLSTGTCRCGGAGWGKAADLCMNDRPSPDTCSDHQKYSAGLTAHTAVLLLYAVGMRHDLLLKLVPKLRTMNERCRWLTHQSFRRFPINFPSSCADDHCKLSLPTR